jgi:orotate phosphoribosyltransferase
VKFVAVLVDRQEGGREKIEQRGYKVISVFEKNDLLTNDVATTKSEDRAFA